MPYLLRRRGPSRAITALAVFALALVALAGCSSKKPSATPSAGPTVQTGIAPRPTPSGTGLPTANFGSQGVEAYDAQDRQSANTAANQVAHNVIDAVNNYYNVAFMVPSDWGGGSFPSLGGLFSSDAAASVTPNLQVLSLGPAAANLSRVDAKTQQGGIVGVLIEDNQSASYATIRTRFEATGHRNDGGPDVTILQSAQFMFDVSSSPYKIVAYDITTSVAGSAKTAAYHSGSTGGFTL